MYTSNMIHNTISIGYLNAEMGAKTKLLFEHNVLVVLKELKKTLFHPQNLSEEKLTRKRELCEEFLDVYSKIDPGSSDWRGSTLFELAMTSVRPFNLGLHFFASKVALSCPSVDRFCKNFWGLMT